MTGTTGAAGHSLATTGPDPDPAVVTLENDLVALTVDGRNGCITGLWSKLTGRGHLTHGRRAEAFRVVMPLRDRISGWFCDPLGHACDSSSQRAAAVQVERRGPKQVLEVTYNALRSDAGTHAVAVEYQAVLEDDSDEIAPRFALTNESSNVVTEAHFPWLVTLRHVADERLVYPNVIRRLRDLFPIPQEGNWEEYPVLLHGTTGRAPYWPGVGGMSMPWVDVGDEQGGIYLASLDHTGRQHSLVVRDHGDGESIEPGLTFAFLLETGPGQHWESPTMVLSPHAGDWHTGADKYRQSIRSWYRPPDVSAHASRSLGAFTTTLTSRDFGEIEELAEDISRYGLTELQVFTFSNYFPLLAEDDDLVHDPPRLGLLTRQFGGRERFRAAVSAARARFGVRTGIILSQRLWNVATLTPDLADKAEAWVMERSSGAPAWRHNHFGADAWGGFRGEQLYVMCPAVEDWQELTIANCRRILVETGATILFFDQAAEYWPCFNEAHAHPDPSASLRASPTLLERLRKELREVDSDAILIGEGAEVVTSQHLDLGWHWEFREKDGPLQLPNPEVTRYTLPRLRFGLPLADDIPTANRWFALGLYLAVIPRGLESGKRLSDFPRFAEHLSRLAALRGRLERSLVHGTFVDDAGIAAEGALAKVYATDDELAVVVASLASDRRRATVRIDPTRWARANEATVSTLAGHDYPAALADDTVTLDLDGYEVRVITVARAA